MKSDDIITPLLPDDEKARLEMGFPCAQNYQKTLHQALKDKNRSDVKDLLRFRRPVLFYNHIPARNVREIVGEVLWRDYQKISIIRNPWDYVISMFYWRTKAERKNGSVSFAKWCEGNTGIFGINNQQYMIDGEVIIDMFIRYEHFENDMRALEKAKPELEGLYDVFSSLSAKGGIRPKTGPSAPEMFGQAPEASALIEASCGFEIERFGYKLS